MRGDGGLVRLVAADGVRSGWILDIFKIRFKCFVDEMIVGSKRK